jgi:predicted Zn-dependent protease
LQQEVQRRAAKEAEARAQQQLAVAEYREARAAIHQMLVRLEDNQLADVLRLLELRLHQLEDALAFYQQVLRERDEADSAVRFDTAQAYLQAAKIEQLLGKPIGQDHAEQATPGRRSGSPLPQTLLARSV